MGDSQLMRSGMVFLNEGSHSFICHPCLSKSGIGYYSFLILLRIGG